MIRNAIVGTIKRLRMAMSVRPRALAADFASSLLSTLGLARRFRRRPEVASVPPGAAARLLLTVSLVLVERPCPIGFDAVERLLGRSLAIDDVGIEPLIELVQEFGVFWRSPEILDHQHRLIEGLVVGRCLAELRRLKDSLAAGVAAKLSPFLLGRVLHEPL